MIAMNHRLTNSVVNRLTYPADGDILVPVHTVCIIGTTDQKADDPDRLEIAWDEVFGYLRETSYDGPLSVCVFGWEEDADAIHVRMRERIEAELR